MNKRPAVFLVMLFLLFYLFNVLTPMSFGDDYVYAFIWQGHSEYEPLTEEAVRVSSFRDLFTSQWLHYFTWSGRVVSHTIIQFFLWMGKETFNIFNTFVSVLLIIEIYWISHKGRVTTDFDLGTLCFISFVLWAFTPGFSPVFFWLSGSCNYLWMAVLLLGFLLPYIRKYYSFEDDLVENHWFKYVIFFFGVLSGWSNENSICWIILVIAAFIYSNRDKQGLESWMFAGIIGLAIGYALLMLAPGNVVRLNAELGNVSGWYTIRLFKENLAMLSAVFLFQFFLWYFSLRSLFLLKKQVIQNEDVKKDILLVKALCTISLGMTTLMLFSPNFPPRSSFPGTVQLVIATCVLLRIQEEYRIELFKKNAKRFLCVIAVCYSIISVSASLYGFFDYHTQVKSIVRFITSSVQAKENVVTAPALRPVSETIANASGLHILYYTMTKNENDWRNVAFARYFGIRGIRLVDENVEREKR